MDLLHKQSSQFQTAASALGPRGSESVCEPFKSGSSVLYSPLGLLDVSLIGFQSEMFWGIVSLMQVPRVGVPAV